jgi:hypothetical protein
MAGHSSSVAQNGNIVQAVHAGVNFAFVNFKSGGSNTPFSSSVSDTINVLNLPRNARVIAAWIGGATVDGNRGFTLGDPGSATRYGGPFTISATTRQQIPMDAPMGFVFSVSDDQNSYPLTLTLQNATSVSGSLSIHVGVQWIKV